MPITSPYPPLDIQATNVLDYIFPAGETLSDEPVWIDSQDTKKSISPKQALQWIKRTAFGLQRLGLQRGDVVMIYSPNHIFVPPTYYGIVGAGFVFSAANPAYNVPELVHQMKNLGAKVLFVHPEFLKPAVEAASQAGIPQDHIFQFTDTPVPTRGGIADWQSMLGTPSQGDSYRWPKLSAEEARSTVATINFSSGTTGLPKGVCVSHFNLIANSEQTTFLCFPKTPFLKTHPDPSLRRGPVGETWLGMLPLYHAFGQSWIIFLAVRLRIPVYIMKTFGYEAFLKVVQDYRVTMLQVPPPVLAMLCKRPETDGYDLSSLKRIISGAAPLSRELQNEVQTRFGVVVTQGWGMTEVTCGGMLVPGGVTDERGSVGVLLPGMEAKVVDEEGREVARGDPGDLFVKGPQLAIGYWRNELATKDTFGNDGWLNTGDVVVADEKGWFWIVDRKKELIKVNALQVAPAELEQILLENEHISDAAVVGITIDENEWPRAYCTIQTTSVGKVTPEQIQEWIKPKVAKYKYLVGGVIFINEVPRLQSGKIQRKVMREWAKKDAEELKKTGVLALKARI